MSLPRQIPKYQLRNYHYTLTVYIHSTMKITLRPESSTRHFHKTQSQSDYFIQHQQKLKIRLFFKCLLWILPICNFPYLFMTFINIPFGSKDNTLAKIYFCGFLDTDAHISSVQKNQSCCEVRQAAMKQQTSLQDQRAKVQPSITTSKGHICYFHLLQPLFHFPLCKQQVGVPVRCKD